MMSSRKNSGADQQENLLPSNNDNFSNLGGGGLAAALGNGVGDAGIGSIS